MRSRGVGASEADLTAAVRACAKAGRCVHSLHSRQDHIYIYIYILSAASRMSRDKASLAAGPEDVGRR